MEKQKGGRPTKFEQGRVDAILEAISRHVPYRMAAEANGVGERTFYYWLKQGIEDIENGVDSDFSRFLQSLRKIESNRITEYTENILKTSKGHKGCQWVLEHVFWKYFSSSAPIIELNKRFEQLERNS